MSAELGGLFSKRKLYRLNIVKLPEQISFFRIYNTTARVFFKILFRCEKCRAKFEVFSMILIF